MRIVWFAHSFRSCWNHGNAHFLRGVASELASRGHDLKLMEPDGAWSLAGLLADLGDAGLEPWRRAYPELVDLVRTYGPDLDLTEVLDGADLVLVHEWNEPWLVAAVGAHRVATGRYTLLFHDTHHRAVSDPAAMRAYDLCGYDGILVFGEALAEVYRDWGWRGRVFVWHEAADIRRFAPPAEEGRRDGVVFVGNWGDGERTDELERFLFRPTRETGLPLDVWGVRYPPEGLAALERTGARYRGFLPNASASQVFAHHVATIHVPRRYYATILPGIPTIRVFEALAAGIPLISAPWEDAERLFRPGDDFLTARSTEEVAAMLVDIVFEPRLRHTLARKGRETILARHTCAHRADELLAIAARLGIAAGGAEPGMRDERARPSTWTDRRPAREATGSVEIKA